MNETSLDVVKRNTRTSELIDIHEKLSRIETKQDFNRKLNEKVIEQYETLKRRNLIFSIISIITSIVSASIALFNFIKCC